MEESWCRHWPAARPAVVARIPTSTGVHGRVVAAHLEEMKDVTGPFDSRTVTWNFGTPGPSGRAV